MFKQHLQNLSGFQNSYLIFSLIVFMVFFAGVLWFIFKADKRYLKEMAEKPLEN